MKETDGLLCNTAILWIRENLTQPEIKRDFLGLLSLIRMASAGSSLKALVPNAAAMWMCGMMRMP